MTAETSTTSRQAGQDDQNLTITRVFDAPRELVFRAWTECEHFVQWWGPKGFTTTDCQVDLRPGGTVRFCMRWPDDGAAIWCGGIYQEVVPPERLVTTSYFTDEQGARVPPAHYGLPATWPLETIFTVTLEDVGGKTRLTLEQNVPLAMAEPVGAVEGWNSSFDKLAEYLEARR